MLRRYCAYHVIAYTHRETHGTGTCWQRILRTRKTVSRTTFTAEWDTEEESRTRSKLQIRLQIDETVIIHDPFRRQHPPSIPADAYSCLQAANPPGEYGMRLHHTGFWSPANGHGATPSLPRPDQKLCRADSARHACRALTAEMR